LSAQQAVSSQGGFSRYGEYVQDKTDSAGQTKEEWVGKASSSDVRLRRKGLASKPLILAQSAQNTENAGIHNNSTFVNHDHCYGYRMLQMD